MNISCIVAMGNNNVIGKDNDIPWYLPADLKYFKKHTINNVVIMGRKCYESIGRPLPKRTNIIITRDPYFISSNCLIAHSIEEALALSYDFSKEEIFIIGGGIIYEQTKNLWHKLYLTRVDIDVKGDVFFPNIDFSNWTLTSTQDHKADKTNPYDYSFEIYKRKI